MRKELFNVMKQKRVLNVYLLVLDLFGMLENKVFSLNCRQEALVSWAVPAIIRVL